MRAGRVIFMIGVGVFGWWANGNPIGIFYALVGFGVLCFIWYALSDFIGMLMEFFRPQSRITINVTQGEATKGHPDVEGTARHPDPTRPTETVDDFAGMITYRLKGKLNK